MSWIQNLYDTYERARNIKQKEDAKLFPIAHTSQKAHIEIVLNEYGEFLRANAIPPTDTIIPATEKSANRTRGGAPHPLCDKLQYVAGDYLLYGGKKEFYFNDFVDSKKKHKDGYYSTINKWQSGSRHHKLQAVFSYISRETVVKDLIDSKIIQTDEKGKMLIIKGNDPGDLFVRWIVEIPGVLESRSWEDEELRKLWINYYQKQQGKEALCYITGEIKPSCLNHPARLRVSGDKAKIISSNDTKGYTYRGKFVDFEQACSISYEASQKVHSALRWLVARQGCKNIDGQVFVAWAIEGHKIPDPWANSLEIFGEPDDNIVEEAEKIGDIGQAFALRLSKKIKGYAVEMGSSNNIVVMGMDSSSIGRMAIIYYRELTGSDFLEKIETWHKQYAWHQNYGGKKFVGAPSPGDIAEVAYGQRADKKWHIDEKVKKATIKRISPCIIDKVILPRDIVELVVNRTLGRTGMQKDDWEKTLGIACALFRGVHKERGYIMALEKDRTTRDYLYGRLLAVAEYIEYRALNYAKENRPTMAEKMMQRFATNPYSTWITIEQALNPYKIQLKRHNKILLKDMKYLLDAIHDLFKTEDYTNNARLTGEFLLGYHCMRKELLDTWGDPQSKKAKTVQGKNENSWEEKDDESVKQ